MFQNIFISEENNKLNAFIQDIISRNNQVEREAAFQVGDVDVEMVEAGFDFHRKNCRVFVEYPVSFSPLGASGFRLPLQRGNGKRLSSFPVRGAGSGCRPDTAIARFPGWLTAPGRGRKAGLHLPFAATRAGNRFRFVPGGGDAIRFSGRGTGRSGMVKK